MKEFAKEVKKTFKKAYPDYYINLEIGKFPKFYKFSGQNFGIF